MVHVKELIKYRAYTPEIHNPNINYSNKAMQTFPKHMINNCFSIWFIIQLSNKLFLIWIWKMSEKQSVFATFDLNPLINYSTSHCPRPVVIVSIRETHPTWSVNLYSVNLHSPIQHMYIYAFCPTSHTASGPTIWTLLLTLWFSSMSRTENVWFWFHMNY